MTFVPKEKTTLFLSKLLEPELDNANMKKNELEQK